MATSAEWHEDYDKMSEASRNFSQAIKSERAEQTRGMAPPMHTEIR